MSEPNTKLYLIAVQEHILYYLKSLDKLIPKSITLDDVELQVLQSGTNILKFGPREIFFDQNGGFDGSGFDLTEQDNEHTV